MTAATLIFYIGMGILGQIVLGTAYALWRRSAAIEVRGNHADPVEKIRSAGAWNGLRAFIVQRREYEDAAQSQCSFYLVPKDGVALPDFKPGQFLTFNIPISGGDGEVQQTITRCYSLSDAPDSARYRITVKRVSAPAGHPELPAGQSSNYLHEHVRVGDILQLRAPAGHFHIDAGYLTPVVLIAGGIGITPMMSMLLWCLQHQPQRAIHLYYGLRNGDEHAFKKVLMEIVLRTPHVQLTVAYSRPLESDRLNDDFQHLGHVDINLLRQTLPRGPHQFYLCGPAPMMEALVPALEQWGVPSSDIHFEAFGPASVRAPKIAANVKSAQAVDVYFARSGRTLQWSGLEGNLLDFAEKHGISVESGCRSGSCGSCVTPISSGSVTYDSPPDFDLSSGQCLLCVGKPASAVTLEA